MDTLRNIVVAGNAAWAGFIAYTLSIPLLPAIWFMFMQACTAYCVFQITIILTDMLADWVELH